MSFYENFDELSDIVNEIMLDQLIAPITLSPYELVATITKEFHRQYPSMWRENDLLKYAINHYNYHMACKDEDCLTDFDKWLLRIGFECAGESTDEITGKDLVAQMDSDMALNDIQHLDDNLIWEIWNHMRQPWTNRESTTVEEYPINPLDVMIDAIVENYERLAPDFADVINAFRLAK